jgi:hypothetical protein
LINQFDLLAIETRSQMDLMDKISQAVQDAPNGTLTWDELMAELAPGEQRRALSVMKPGERAGLFQRRVTVEDGRGIVRIRTLEADAEYLASLQGGE